MEQTYKVGDTVFARLLTAAEMDEEIERYRSGYSFAYRDNHLLRSWCEEVGRSGMNIEANVISTEPLPNSDCAPYLIHIGDKFFWMTRKSLSDFVAPVVDTKITNIGGF